MMPIIEAHELTRNYDRLCALDKVDLTVSAGEWLSIMGPSGSGKTTLLNLLSCLDRPTSGSLVIDGTDVTRLGPAELTRFRRETVGLIFQQFHLVPYLNALENVMLAQYFHSMADEDEARRALEGVGLVDRAHHLPSQLSGGEQQRVCIARAFINEPRIILADEPTGNLDSANEELVMEIFRRLHSAGHTIIVVTHNSEVAESADRIIRLEHGRIAAATRNRDRAEAACFSS